MSSPEIRAAARAVVAGGAWPAVPFRETVDQVPDEGRPDVDATPQWCTLLFETFTDDAIGIGGETLYREEGEVVFRFYSVGGDGDGTLLPLVDAARSAIRDHAWGASGIYVASLTPPQAVADEDDTWATYDVVLAYERDHAAP